MRIVLNLKGLSRAVCVRASVAQRAACYAEYSRLNARRYAVDLSPYPTLLRIEAECMTLPAFANVAPEKQEDAVSR